MKWQDCLLKEAEAIVNYGQGELKLFVTRRRKDNYISIQILAGRRFDFEIKDFSEED